MRTYGHDGRLIGNDGARPELGENPLLQVILRKIGFRPNLRGGVLEGFAHDAVDGPSRFQMRLELLRAPGGLELLHQIGRTHHRAAARAHHLHRAGIDHGNIRNGVARRILHGDFARAADEARKILVQLVQAGVDQLLAGQSIERAGFDAMHQLARSPSAGNEVKPAARAHAAVQPQDASGNGIAMMKIVEEPAVQAGGSQLFLNVSD